MLRTIKTRYQPVFPYRAREARKKCRRRPLPGANTQRFCNEHCGKLCISFTFLSSTPPRLLLIRRNVFLAPSAGRGGLFAAHPSPEWECEKCNRALSSRRADVSQFGAFLKNVNVVIFHTSSSRVASGGKDHKKNRLYCGEGRKMERAQTFFDKCPGECPL